MGATIKQGQSVKIRFKFDESYEGVIYIGLYRDGLSKSVMMWNTGDRSLVNEGNNEWSKTLNSCVTKEMEVGNYYIEMLAREDDDRWVAIGSDRACFSVENSNIGKEIAG